MVRDQPNIVCYVLYRCHQSCRKMRPVHGHITQDDGMCSVWAPTLWVSRQASHSRASSETTPSAAIVWAYKASPIRRNLSPMEQEQLYLCEVSSHPHLRNLSREPSGHCLPAIQPTMAARENSSSPQQSVVTVLPCPVTAAWTGSVTYFTVVFIILPI